MDLSFEKNSRNIVFYHSSPFENIDIRRAMSGIAGDFGFPLQIKQLKLITFTEESVKNRLVVGNHRHFGESGQWEVIIVLGNENTEYIDFRYRNHLSNIGERRLVGGDIVIIPPGCSLALIPLIPSAQVIEISNQEYRNINYENDILF